jgi:hypothetical protein
MLLFQKVLKKARMKAIKGMLCMLLVMKRLFVTPKNRGARHAEGPGEAKKTELGRL